MISVMEPLKQSEHQIQTTIVHLLRIKGYYVMRLNSGKFSVGEGRTKRFINGQSAGTPDLMAFKEISGRVRLLFIEVKRPGKKPTILQAAKMKELTDYGAICLVATSPDDLTSYL